MTQTKQPKAASKSSSHTPGPWRVDSITGRIIAQSPVYPGDEDRCIAELGESLAFSQQERVANARLTAAALEMYELLSTIIKWYENSGSTEPCAGSVDLWSAARRIKAAIDGDG